MRTLSIRTQLLLLVAVAAVPLIGAATYDVFEDLRQSELSARRSMRTLASVMATNTTARLEIVRQALERFAAQHALAPDDLAGCERRLGEALVSCQHCVDVFITGPSGEVRCAGAATNGQRRSGSVADAAWFKHFTSRAGFTASSPVVDPPTGQRVTLLSVPLSREGEAASGGIHASLRLEVLDPHLPLQFLPPDARLGFTDPEGVTVWRKPDAENLIGLPHPLGRDAPPLLAQSGYFEAAGLDGVQRLYAAEPMPLTGWVAFIGVPMSWVRAAPLQHALTTAPASAVGVVLLLLLAVLISRRILSPIVALAQFARDARAPGFEGLLEPQGPVELVDVAEALNELLRSRRKSEEELRAFLENSAVIAWMKDEGGRYVFASKRFLARLGFTHEALIGKTDADVWPPEDAANYRAQDLKRFREGGADEYVQKIPNPDGTRSTWLVHKFLFVGTDQRRLVGGLAVDLSEVERAEEARRLSDAQLTQAFETSPIGMSIGTLDSRYLRVNEAFCRMLGRTQEEMIALGPFGITAPADLERGKAEVEELLSGRRSSVTAEKRYLHRLGHEVWVLRTLSIVRDAEGKPVHFLAQVQDISERKAAEASARLATVGTLAAGAAHEINNPLTYVLGNLAWVQDELKRLEATLTAEQRAQLLEPLEALAEAQGGAERIAGIIAGLKAFSRMSEQPLEPTDVGRVMETALQLTVAQRRNQARTVKRLEPAPLVLASARQLEQVFINLLVNAAQAIPEGNAETNTITVTVKPGAGDEVVAEVADTGTGISDEVMPRLFEPFFTTKPVGAGTGLGLPTCHGIVTSFGGRIEVESRLGHGSTFRVVLPGLPVNTEVPPRAELAPVPLPSRGRVLIIDDELAVARGLARALRNGPELIIESDPREALRRLEQGEAFDLVLCDLMMPSLSGEELQRQLRLTRPSLADEMVFITGGAFTVAATAFLATTRNVCLQKPVEANTLRKVVAERLSPPGG